MLRACGFWLGVFAFAATALSQSAPRVSVPTRDVPFTPPRKWALVIGANEYDEIGKLRYAAKDALAFSKTLQERFEFRPDAIETLTDLPDSKLKPTAENMIAALDRQIADVRLKDGDLFIFYFSGHGMGTPKGDYLLPTNATTTNAEQVGIHVKEVINRFVKAGLRNVLFIVDACRGGTKNSFGDDLRALGKQANIAVLLGCQPGARSYEYATFGHGAFTNFLLKSLKSKELQSEVTGALWASRIAKDVATKVQEYTVRDYPNQPQTPTGWTEETMDVLLGAFPNRGAARLKIADIVAESNRLPEQTYLDALERFADDMFAAERYADAVEAYRTVDAVRKLESDSRFELAMALNYMGRTLEMDNEVSKLMAGKPDDVYRHMAVLFNPSRMVTPRQRLDAGWALWKLAPHPWTVQAVWPAFQIHAPQSETNLFLTEYLKLPSIDDRSRRYFEGHVAGNRGDWADAEKLWLQAKDLPGEYPDRKTIELSLFQALAFTGKAKETVAFIQRLIQEGSDSAILHLVLAEFYKGQDEMHKAMKEVDAALSSSRLRDDDLLWILRLTGLRYVQFAEKISKRASEMPYVWRAMLVKMWVDKAHLGDAAIIEGLNEASKFCDDEFAVYFEILRILDVSLEELFVAGKLDPAKYSNLLLVYASLMAQNVTQFGYDSDAWSLYNSFAVRSEKYDEMRALFDKYLGPQVEAGTLDQLLRPTYFFATLQYGDTRRAEQIWKLAGMAPNEVNGAAWALSMYFATQGDLARAKSLIPSGVIDKSLEKMINAYKAYLDVRDGEPVDLKAIAEGVKDTPAGLQWIGLAYAYQKDWKAAMAIFKEVILERQAGFIFVQAAAAQTYFDRLLAEGRLDDANEFAYVMSTSAMGNPLYKKIYMGKPELGSYAGKISADAAEFDPLADPSVGTASLTFDGKGGLVVDATVGGVPKKLTAKIDMYGNVNGVYLSQGKECKVLGKLPPPAHWAKLPESNKGLILAIIDDKGQSRYLLMRKK